MVASIKRAHRVSGLPSLTAPLAESKTFAAESHMRSSAWLSGLRRGHKVLTFDISMDLVLIVKVLETEQKLSTDDCDMRFGERTGFELFRESPDLFSSCISLYTIQLQGGGLTRSKQDPPARYSITIFRTTFSSVRSRFNRMTRSQEAYRSTVSSLSRSSRNTSSPTQSHNRRDD